VLIHELHGHTATKRLTDNRRARDAQFVEQITQPHGERTKRVITSRLVRLPMAEQVGRHHPVLLGQLRDHRPPGL